MDIVYNIASYFKRKNQGENIKAPDGICPNCWGEQEYDGVVRKMVQDKQIDVNNHEANYAFIQDFVITRIDGIRLKNAVNGMACPRCKGLH